MEKSNTKWTKEKILAQIDKGGYLWINQFNDEEFDLILQLEKEGIIANLEQEGIRFINETYCYVRKGNPDSISIKTIGNESYVYKPEKLGCGGK